MDRHIGCAGLANTLLTWMSELNYLFRNKEGWGSGLSKVTLYRMNTQLLRR